MKKSKYLAFGLSALLALSLTSCGGQQAQEPQEPKQEIQQAEPISTEPTAEPVEVKQEVPEERKGIEDSGVSGEDVSTDGKKIDTGTPEEAVQLFTDANETVYATGTVNIRASYTADSEKLGSLSSGQSVTRTGTAIEGTEAEGWSRVSLSDGSTAYISSKYLSTTKPVAQQQASKPSGQQQQTQQAAKPSGQQQTQQSTSSSQKIDGHDDIGDYVLTGNGYKYYPAYGFGVPVDFDNKGHNGAPPQTAEEQELAKKAQEAALESPDWHTESWQGVNMG